MKKMRWLEDKDNPDRWVVSYADFITLLFAFFTALYAISHVDLGKLDKFQGSVKSAFNTNALNNDSILEGISDRYSQSEEYVRGMLNKLSIDNVSIFKGNHGIVISMGESALFDSGTADIKDEAKPLLSSIAQIIKATKFNVIIEGHTDNLPIKNSAFSSNWELSSARAIKVLLYFLNEHYLEPSRFSVSGYGEYKPIATNSTFEGRRKNRRVDIILQDKGKVQTIF